MTNKQETEKIIQQNYGYAPKLKPEDIDHVIMTRQFHVFPQTGITVCLVWLQNGHYVIGESECLSSENFDKELGEKIAYDNARNKICGLEGYLLKERELLHQKKISKSSRSLVSM